MRNSKLFLARPAFVLVLLLLAGCGSTFFGKSEGPPLPGERVTILESNRSVSPNLEIAQVPVDIPAVTDRPNWPQVDGSSSHVGSNIALSSTPSLLWQSSSPVGARDEARRPPSPPIIANGRVFVLDSVLNVRAYDAQSGQELWAVGTAPDGEHDGFGGGIATDGVRVYMAGGHGQLLALEADTGRLFWRKDLPGPVRAAPTVRGERVFVITADNRLIALSTETGERLWDVPGGGQAAGILGGASPAASDLAVIAALSTGEVVAVRTANGRELWRNSLAALRRFDFGAKLSDIGGQPVLTDDTVYAIGAAGRAAAFSLRTGNRIWEQRIGGTQTPWVVGKWVFLVSDGAELIAIDRENGLVRWVQALPRYEDPEDRDGEYLYAGPVLAGGNLVLVRSDGKLMLQSVASGAAVAEIDIGDHTLLPPVIADSTIYTLSEDGTLRAFR
ncbi:MAG: PQQ-binding-like beta-propeller repeat protein [Alphaproteobacteria bacterium]